MRTGFRGRAVALGVLVAVFALALAATALAAPGRPGYNRTTGMAANGHCVAGIDADAMQAIHDRVTAAVAERLGLTPEAVEAAMAGGKTLADLATEQGVPLGEVWAAKVQAMNQALDDLVKAGQLDPAVAATMRAHMARHTAQGMGPGVGPGGGQGFRQGFGPGMMHFGAGPRRGAAGPR